MEALRGNQGPSVGALASLSGNQGPSVGALASLSGNQGASVGALAWLSGSRCLRSARACAESNPPMASPCCAALLRKTAS
jgi:hypothetical protein